MQANERYSVARAVALGVAAVGGGGAAAWVIGPPELAVATLRRPVDFEQALATLCAAGALLLSAWCVLMLVSVITAQLAVRVGRWPGHLLVACSRICRFLTPRVIRRVVHAAVGGAVAVGPLVGAGTAFAVPTPTPATPHSQVGPGERGFSGWDLDWPRSTAPSSAPAEYPADREEYVVIPGDTLWDIAAKHLGPDATPADIAAEWPRWYAANKEVVGPNPDFILPGEHLRPPTSP